MSQTYQDSPNCMLEVKFAKQSGIEIVPVLMQGGGWKASGWLGLLTAGALWTPLYDDTLFEQNMNVLHQQLLKIIGLGASEADNFIDSTPASLAEEAQEELSRLRDEVLVSDPLTSAVVMADPSEPATIPAGVPKLPARFRSTEQISELTRLVLSPSSEDMSLSRIGFFGMGGIGKTVTGAAIVRNEAVRLHFDGIVWLPLGQSPTITKIQNLCHIQCTGRELSPELSSEERKETLQQAMAGKKLLLCLDDLWQEDDETQLNFADVSCGSKVLISTRIRGLLAGAQQVEVCLPSPMDSTHMLLAAADVNSPSPGQPHPKGVSEIVDLCGRLPLALGIAGRLVANLGLSATQDWSGVIQVLREELRESHSGGTEEGMIRASLRGLKGSVTEQQNVKWLLKLFALVPEDTHCSLEVLMLMFNAIHPDAPATIMHLRKWLRVLIDRSLVLGTIDRPSLHDLVLDYVVAQHKAQELYQQHSRVVQAFRGARPADSSRRGRREFERRTIYGSPVAKYVCNEIEHHVSRAAKVMKASVHSADSSSRSDTDNLMNVLEDYPQDEIVRAAGRVLGIPHITDVATSAEHAGNWWLAARCWSLLTILVTESSQYGLSKFVENCQNSLAASAKVLGSIEAAHQSDLHYQVQSLQLDQYRMLSTSMDEEVIGPHRKAMEQILQTEAAKDNILKAATLELFLSVPLLFAADKRPAAARFERLCRKMLLARPNVDPATSYSLYLLVCAFQHHMDIFLESNPDHDFDFFLGVGGSEIVAAMEKYDFDIWHRFLIINNNVDAFALWADTSFVAIHYGNMRGTYTVLDKSMIAMRMAMEMPDQTSECFSVYFGVPVNALLLVAIGAPVHFIDTLCDLTEMYQLTWAGASRKVDLFDHPTIRPRGDQTMDKYSYSAEYLTFLCQFGHVLVSRAPPAEPDEIVERLPSVKEIIEFSMLNASSAFHSGFVFNFNPFIMAAAICEKFERHERTLEYAHSALCTDQTQAGNSGPTTHTLALLMQGRAYAALGRVAEAGAALEAAASRAHQYQLWLFEAFALRDLKQLVLDPMGHGEYGAQRLGEALRLLVGPAEMLTPLLKGLDAAEMIAHAPPNPDYELAYPSDSDEVVMRLELQKLRLTALQKRASAEGVGEEQLLAAVDSDQPKEALIELLMARCRATAQAQRQPRAQLQEELHAMKLSALQKRALAQSINAEQVNAAMDSDEPKVALARLIMAMPQPTPPEGVPPLVVHR